MTNLKDKKIKKLLSILFAKTKYKMDKFEKDKEDVLEIIKAIQLESIEIGLRRAAYVCVVNAHFDNEKQWRAGCFGCKYDILTLIDSLKE